MDVVHYVSTRGGQEALSFQDAVMAGLASDGGLLVPDHVPDVRPFLREWASLGYADLAFAIMRLFAGDVAPHRLRALVNDAYAGFGDPAVAPTRRLGEGMYLLELFHGPTLAFKDIALQFLGRLFGEILEGRGGRLNILAATSGDTGSAAIAGVRGRERVKIFVMHPHGRVSPLQERQMTTVLDGNVFNIALEGSFDDCQRVMKELFNDGGFKAAHALGAVNSVNWARILAQTVYYFHSAFRVMEETGACGVQFAVPTGNFGDILAGWYAKRMGLPIRRLVLATNENDILARFFNTGRYRRGEVVETINPSMDIQVASNFERWLHAKLGGDCEKTREAMAAFEAGGEYTLAGVKKGKVDEEIVAGTSDRKRTLATIARYHRERGILLDPHSAAGVYVAEQFNELEDPMICLATAHPAKFPGAILEATGEDLAHHPFLEGLKGMETRMEVLPNDVDEVRAYLGEHAR